MCSATAISRGSAWAATMDDLEPSLRRNVRIDGGTGQASVKDVVWAVTHRDGPAAGKLVASLADKYPDLAARFDRRRIDGKGQDVTVGNFEVLTDVIFLVSSLVAAATYPI